MEITGKHVLGGFGFAFACIIGANMTLAVNAVRTFPGLEVKNSYVASQAFDEARQAQRALNWDVSARLAGDVLELRIATLGAPVRPEITQALFGRATSVAQDQHLDFTYEAGVFRAPVTAGPGNWNLRIKARAADGTAFAQRVIVETGP